MSLMKSRISVVHPLTCFFLLTVMLLFISWIGSVYSWGEVQSLLSAEGLRWLLRSIADDYASSPVLFPVVVLFFGCGLWVDSGLGKICRDLLSRRGRFSHRERHALWMAAIAGGIYLGICMLLAWEPGGIVRSAVGTLAGSPFMEGIWCIISLGIGLISVVYAYAVDFYRGDRDIIRGMSCLFIRHASYFVTLFFVVLFFSSLAYTRLAVCMGISSEVVEWLYLICSLLPLLEHD